MPELKITPEVGSDNPDHVQEMISKADGTVPKKPAEGETKASEEATERPAWLPEKFKTPEDMAAAYASLEKKLGDGNKTDETDDATPGDPEEAQKAAEEAVKAAGLDMDALGQKIAKDGDLSDEDYAALSKQGISREMVKTYIEGQRALGEKFVTELHESVGGAEAFNEIIEWAADNLSKAEIDAFNSTVDSNNTAAIKLALSGLQAKFVASEGSKPKLLGGGKSTSSGDVFRSTAELTEAMRSPRYAKDPAYRQAVADKLARSSIM